MRAQRKRKAYSIKLLSAYLGLQAALLLGWPECAALLAFSTLAACGLSYLGFRRLDHPAPRPVLPRVEAGLLELLGHTPEELVGKTVIGVTPVGVAFVRADGVMAEVNPRFAEIVGYPRAELIGRAVSEISLPEEWPSNEALMADAVSGRIDQYQIEKRYRRKDGGRVWAEVSATILRDENGRFLYAISVVVDISERKRSEQSLRESEQRFRTLAELSTDWFWEQDEEFRFARIYGNAYQMGGVNPDDLIGSRRWDRPNYAMTAAEWSAHRAALERHQSFRDFEIRVLDEQGGMNYMEVSGVPVFDEAGRFTGYRGTGRRITARRRAEEALRESETRYASLVASLREGILVRERDATISSCNPGIERIFGLPRERIVGRTSLLPDVEYIKPDGTPFEPGQLPGHVALTTGQPADDVEIGIVLPDGSSRWVVASARPLFRDGESTPHAAVVSLNDITERRAAERELERQRTFLRTVLDSVSSVIFVRDREHRYLLANRALAELYGATPKEMFGRRLVDFNADREQALGLEQSDLALLAAGGATDRYELLIVTAQGEKRWFEMTKRVIADAQGRPDLVLGIGADVTERKRLQEALQHALEVRDTILENSIAGIAFLNEHGRAVWANRAAEQIFRVERGAIVDKSIESFYPSREDYITTGGAVAQAVHAGRAYDAELPMRRGDGTLFWAHLSGKTVNPGELSQGTVWMIVDISERKLAEFELERQRHFLRQIIDSTPNVVFVRDRESRYTMCNRAHAELCGLAPESIIGRTASEIGRRAGEAESALQKDAMAFERGGRLEPFESTHMDAQGAMHWYENSKTVLYDADGVARQVLTVGTEVTQRKQAEAQLQRMNEELERRVAERTQQLEASVKELEAFSYSVSHDLRAPLRAIDGYSQILIEEAGGNLAPEVRLCLDKISRNARHMAELIDRLLAFARYSRAPLERRAIDLAALVRSVIDEQPREARRIEFSVAPLQPCLADAQLLRQVLGNLVANAVKYTRPRDLARIEIGAFERDAATVYFVRDNGVGFDMRYVHKLFGVFQRLHTEKEFEGTGAGLAIVQRIVSRHGGRVWAEGEVGKGASFYFTLGRVAAESESSEQGNLGSPVPLP